MLVEQRTLLLPGPPLYLVMLQVLFGFANEQWFLSEIVPKYIHMKSLKGSIVP